MRRKIRWQDWMRSASSKPTKKIKPKLKEPEPIYTEVPDSHKHLVVGNFKADESNIDAFKPLQLTRDVKPALQGIVLVGDKFPLQVRHFPRKAPAELDGRAYPAV